MPAIIISMKNHMKAILSAIAVYILSVIVIGLKYGFRSKNSVYAGAINLIMLMVWIAVIIVFQAVKKEPKRKPIKCRKAV